MTKYIFDATSFSSFSKNEPKQIIILCHGYGGDGQDISVLALNWRRFLPDAVFLCPNAPEVCAVNPLGYQWFDMAIENDEMILEKSLVTEKKLNTFLDQVLDDYQLDITNLALVGFSQGSMMIIQTALKKKEQINCLVAYSGKIINKQHLSRNIVSRPKIFLMHGDKDAIVSPGHLLESKEFLVQQSLKIKTKLFKNCEHKISVEGLSFGLEFLRKNLL
jgi:phospholipase/carboxylesterase